MSDSITKISSEITAPDWFTKAVTLPREDHYLESNGCRIHYFRWGNPKNPGLLFIHGGGAHARWWDFIAPQFAEYFSVVAVDLSGMGESGWRDYYSGTFYADEIIDVCKHAHFHNPFIVGHSMGGYVAIKTCLVYRENLGGVILVDVPLEPPKESKRDLEKSGTSRQRHIFPTIEAALARFRLIPDQPCGNHYILDYIAHHSLIKLSEGWSWKFDPNLFYRLRLRDTPEDFSNLTKKMAFIYGTKSYFFPIDKLESYKKKFGDRTPFISIQDAYHHLILDHPLEFVQSMQNILKGWIN
jgi:pimeloyl-ACP methyl ester carboxylesterase